jgi:hypothetical protein
MLRRARVVFAAVWASAALTQGCADGCDQETIDRAVAFIEANQSCETDADCVVVSDSCGELPGGYCGQLSINRAGSESAKWRSLSRELSDCAPDSCAVCAAALVPTCTDNLCSKR